MTSYSLDELETVLRRELTAAVQVIDPSDTALTAIRRRILDQAQARRWQWWLLKPCGTPAAYRRHLRHGEKACVPCRNAEAQRAASARRKGTAP